MKAIAAVDQNWAIGYKDQLLTQIPDDMRMFRAETTGKVIIYGRKSLLTFPNQKPLKNRTNIIFSRNPDLIVPGGIVVHNVEEMEKITARFDPEDVYVIGGGSIYSLLLDLCDTALITKIEHTYTADTWFPNLDEDPNWQHSTVGKTEIHNGLEYHFDRYRRVTK